MRLTEVVTALQSVKGRGTWREIAKAANVHYDTLARIARGDIHNPGASTVERIADAIDRVREPVSHEHG